MKLLFILGPTAIGKSNLALQLAKYLKTDIISLDAYQIYKQLNIGTAKPLPQQLNQTKHHMINIINADESFSSFSFIQQVEKIIDKQIVPLLVGGTGFFADSLTYGLDYNNSSNIGIKEFINQELLNKGADYLYTWLTQLDSQAAKAISPHNIRFVSRAIEISLTGHSRGSVKLIDKTPKYNTLNVILTADRDKIYRNIDIRVDEMVAGGLVEEVRYLAQTYTWQPQSMQAIGYKEFKPYFEGSDNLKDCINLVKQHTRQYAKRQLTYFKRMKNTLYIDVSISSSEQIMEQVAAAYFNK